MIFIYASKESVRMTSENCRADLSSFVLLAPSAKTACQALLGANSVTVSHGDAESAADGSSLELGYHFKGTSVTWENL